MLRFETKPQEIEPDDILRSDNEVIELRPGIGWLEANLEKFGQLSPALVAPHPSDPGKFLCIDGQSRCWCLARLKRRVNALVFPRPLTDSEVIEYKLSNNMIRSTMTAEEVGMESARYLEIEGISQTELAKRIAISNATLSRCIARIKKIPPGYEHLARQIGSSHLAVCLTLKTPELRQQALEFAATPGEGGTRRTRDQLTQFVDRLKGKKLVKPSRKKRLRFVVDGREILADLLLEDSHETLIEAFRAVANHLSKHRNLKLEMVAAMLADQDAA